MYLPERFRNMTFILDVTGDLGPPYRAYQNIDNTTENLKLLTPEGFPHPRQVEYFEANTPFVLWAGQRGSGKTFGAVWDNLFTAHLVPGSEQIIFRRTMGELRRTLIAQFLKLPEGLRGRFTDSQTSPRLELPNGSKIHFSSLNDEGAARKYQGGEFLRVTFDEWAQLPYSWWSFVAGSARSTISRDAAGRPVIPQVKGLSNPGGEGADDLRHLFGTDIPKSCPRNLDINYDPDDYTFIPSIMEDNPAYKAETPEGRAYRKMLSAQPRAIREAWLNGRWTGFEGMYFDCFDKEITEIPHNKLLTLMERQKWMPIIMGIDWGQVHHAYVNWNTLVELPLEDGSRKVFFVTFFEQLFKGLSERALAEEIVDFSQQQLGEENLGRIDKIYLSPETFGEGTRSRAKNIGDVFVRNGMRRPIKAKAEKNSRANGLRQMYTLLSDRNTLLDGWTNGNTVCEWLIDETCVELLGALPWAVSDPEKDGDIKSKGDAFQLDVLDGIRYAVYSHYVSTDKPASVAYAERMELIKQGGITPGKSMQLFVEHCKRMKELKAGQDTQSRAGKWSRDRHPRRGGANKPDDSGLLGRSG